MFTLITGSGADAKVRLRCHLDDLLCLEKTQVGYSESVLGRGVSHLDTLINGLQQPDLVISLLLSNRDDARFFQRPLLGLPCFTADQEVQLH